jgi:adenine-specific DNA-methyltransferase
MKKIQLENIFKSAYNYNDWKSLINTLFTNSDFYKTPIESVDKTINHHKIAKSIQEFGTAHLADDKIVKFYDIELEPNKRVTKNRVELRNLIHNEVIPGDVDAILVVFHTPGDKDWRLTFISKSVFWDDDYNENKLETSARRYTYILGEDESVKTAVKQFEKLEGEQLTVKHLIELFNVEKINKKFFDDYKKLYNKFWSYLIDTPQYKKLFTAQDAEKQEKSIRDFTKKLLGRIVFLHFLQKKGWMGCAPHPTEWEQGEKQFLLKLLEGFEDKAHFHSKCLTTLFFSTLNAKREGQIFEVEGLNNTINKTKVPYLNGGLFETDKEVNAKSIDFPISYFEELFDFFGQYNFTIDENSPDDHEVGIDPEMLGHIFENLLEDNKDKGAFYTPKEIVQYMTQESLIKYLQTHLGEHYEIENFIRNHDKGDEQAKENFIRDNAKKIEELLDKVKVCDPAIGSGAFPMGMLNEIFKAKMALDWTLERSEVKKAIIQNSIYGVDLESGAVDIARLRFWLALVVDEKDPQALPNLDYKIMQGNSLLESFESIDLSEIHEGIAIEIDTEKTSPNLFSEDLKRKKGTENEEKLEDLIHTYFDLDQPEEKKALHNKIDRQVLNNIYFTLNDHKESLEKEYKKLNRKIKSKSATLRTADQKIKYETESKDAKTFKKFNIQLEDVHHKQLKLTQLYKSNDRPFFLWHLMFKEVFDEGGFDIVIGNPPYIKEDENKNAFDGFRDISPYYQGKMDLWYGFGCMCIDLLKENGIECFIAQNNWITSAGASKLRDKVLRETEIKIFTDFWNYKVFNSAGIQTMIYLLQKTEPKDFYNVSYSVLNQEKLNLTQVQDFLNFSIENNYSKKHIIEYKNKNYFDKLITFNPPHIQNILNKIVENSNTKLKSSEVLSGIDIPQDFLNKKNKEKLGDSFDVGMGIFVLSDEEANNLKLENIERELLKPYYTTKELLKYYGNKINKNWIIYTDSSYKDSSRMDNMPILREHLDKFQDIITSENKPYGLNRARKDGISFEGNKIISKRKCPDSPTFTYTDFDTYFNRTFMQIITNRFNLKFLTSLLNSSLIKFWLRYKGKMQGNNYQIDKGPLIDIPILKSKNESFFAEIVDYILKAKEFQFEINEEKEKIEYEVISQTFEEIIDAMMFELYFPNDFKEAGIEILKLAEQEFIDLQGKPEEDQKEIILATYQRLTEKKNPLRNQIKLMKIELKELLNPILSV